MSDPRVRLVEFERGQIDMKTGEFPMILATDGEASDGDILSIEGAQFGGRAPLQLSHINDPRATAGSITGFRRDLQSSPKKLRAKGQIELGGEGPAADIRRDVAYMISHGHVTGISVRWEPIEYTRRANLPEDHPAYVNADTEKDWRKRYGYFHKKWRVLEGSIVAVQADKEAMIGRAEQTEGPVAAFWRAMAEDAKAPEEIAELPEEPPAEETERAAVKPPTRESLKAAFAAQVRELEAAGLTADDLRTVLEEQEPKAPPSAQELTALLDSQTREIAAMRAELAEMKGRGTGAPTPPLRSVAAIVNHLESMLEASNARALAATQALIEKKVGRVSPALQTFREIAHAEAQEVIRKARETEVDSIFADARAGLDSAPEEGDRRALEALVTRMESMIDGAKKNLAPKE